MSNPLVSILMPVFNAAPWLEECLSSIQQQTLVAWELLAVDDFSTDNSPRILAQYAQKDPRIKVFSNRNKGIIPALRLAFKKSTGFFITRMDADDVMSPQKLTLLMQCLSTKGPGHVATGWVKYISENKVGPGYQRYEAWLNELCTDNNHYRDIYRECVIPSPCWMTYRTDLIQCGDFTPDRYPEDYDLCFRFYQNKLKVTSVKTVLHFWRDHPDRTSRTSSTYTDHRYLDIKLHWFFQLDFDSSRPLVLWGAGKKGKLLAQKITATNIPFIWVTNNPRKQDVNINGVLTTSHLRISALDKPQIIVAVAAPDDQDWIQQFLESVDGPFDRWFFC